MWSEDLAAHLARLGQWMLLHAVPLGMLFRCHYFEVFQPIVALVAIDVVNKLKPAQSPANLFLHEPSMLAHCECPALR
jgi:hypothetical protein